MGGLVRCRLGIGRAVVVLARGFITRWFAERITSFSVVVITSLLRERVWRSGFSESGWERVVVFRGYIDIVGTVCCFPTSNGMLRCSLAGKFGECVGVWWLL